jgi:ABC-type transport system involved in multi-copper enzyme maturation permease subunit
MARIPIAALTKGREVFRFEFEHRVRSASTWLSAGFLFLVAIWMFLATADGEGMVNAPERLAGGSAIVGMFGALISAAIFGDAAVRDVKAGMDPLLYTSPLTRAHYLGGRYLAALLVNLLIVPVIPLGFITATRIAGSFETFGAFRLVAYVQPFLLFVVPNVVIVGALLFTIGVLARGVIPVYLGAVGIFVGNIVTLNLVEGIASPVVAVVADPTGIAALMATTRGWTEAERNTQLVGLPTFVAWNRLLWITIALAVLALLVRRFRLAHADGGGQRRSAASAVAAMEELRLTAPVAVPRVNGTHGRRAGVRQALAIARQSLMQLAATRSFALVLLGLVGLTLLFGWNVSDTVFDTSTWPLTFLVAEEVLSSRVVPLVWILLALYAGELAWSSRESGSAELVDAAPVTELVLLTGRFLALVAMLVLWLLALMEGGLLIQALQGYYQFEFALYLRILFGLNLAHWMLLAVLAMTVHVVVNHKYLGHLVVLLLIGSARALPPLGLVRHRLLLYGTDPGWTYSEMNGFGPFLAPWAWFKAYWGAWALLLLVASCVLWVRGSEAGWRHRWRAARERWVGGAVRATAVALVLMLTLGGWIFYNTNVLNTYRTAGEESLPKARYEKEYARFERALHPTITAAELRVELYPEQGAMEVRGRYSLANRGGTPIDSVHVTLHPEVELRRLETIRRSRVVLADTVAGYRILALQEALAPGDSLHLDFEAALVPRGFRNGRMPTEVVRNGSRIDRRWFPMIGYQRAMELESQDARARHGLAPRRVLPGADDVRALRQRFSLSDADLVSTSTVVGTSADQVAIAPGTLRRSWTENGRRYFHYESDGPTAFGGTVYSGRFAVRTDRWRDVELAIRYHPSHARNLDRMMRGMKESLEYFSAQFGPYKGRALEIVEFPRYGGFGVAHANLIGFTEDALLSRVQDGEIDQPFYGTAHEVAHQWWGWAVRGAVVKGIGFLSESLANYSAMMATEKFHGPDVARRVYDFQMERYLTGRVTQSREVPLLDVEDQPYIAYRKGAVAMYTLRERIGEERVNSALRRFADRFRDAAPPYPTSRELYAELRAVTPDSLHGMLADWFEHVTLWELRTVKATMEPAAAGRYRVTLEVEARKLRADSAGRETEVSMDEWVEVGVRAPYGEDKDGPMLFLAPHRIRSGRQVITVEVSARPGSAGIDPRRTLTERIRDNNIVAVEAAGGSP